MLPGETIASGAPGTCRIAIRSSTTRCFAPLPAITSERDAAVDPTRENRATTGRKRKLRGHSRRIHSFASKSLHLIQGHSNGATTFSHFQSGQNADAAFAEAVSQALYDHGHNGYTGTIVEKSGFQLRNGGKPMTGAEAQAFSSEDEEANEKWGPAFALVIRKDDGAEIIGYLFYGWAGE